MTTCSRDNKKGETEDFGINKRVRQGDVAILTLNAVIEERNIKGTIINKRVKALALEYADDFNVLVRNRRNLKEEIQKVEQEAK